MKVDSLWTDICLAGERGRKLFNWNAAGTLEKVRTMRVDAINGSERGGRKFKGSTHVVQSTKANERP